MTYHQCLSSSKRALLFDPDNARLPYNFACAMAKLCDADALWMHSDNSLDSIREHPRFVELMARTGRRFTPEA